MKTEILGSILLFDGVCNLCNGFLQEVITRDKKGIIYYASLQSEAGKLLLREHDIDTNLDSVILIEQERVFIKSDVALRIFYYLGGGWKILSYLSFVPRIIRDTIYDWIAKNRYSWFGKKENCMIPRPEWEDRFIK